MLQTERRQKSASRNPVEHGLLFFGNQHETVPTQLLYDMYLTPRAKYAWQIIKSRAREFTDGIFPSYDMLATMLSDRPYCHAKLSRKVITQTLLALRLTRWLTLSETARNEKGQVIGNVYILHDEPMPILDAIQLDDSYLALLEKCSEHKDPVVNGIANHIIENVLSDEAQWHYISHIDWIQRRYKNYQQRIESFSQGNTEKTATILQSSNMELSKNVRELGQKDNNLLSSKMELSANNNDKSLKVGRVPLGNSVEAQYSTSTIRKYKYSTVETGELCLPKNIHLTQLEKNTLLDKVAGLDRELCQSVFKEAECRIARDANKIRNPKAYLFNLIRLAQEGKFKVFLSKAETSGQAVAHRAHHSQNLDNADTARAKKKVMSAEEQAARLQQIKAFSQQMGLR